MNDTGSRCPFCAHPSGLSVRLDRKGRPYIQCESCLTRAFLRSRKALAGVLGLGAVIDEIPSLQDDVRERGERAVQAWLQANQAAADPAGLPSPSSNEQPASLAGGAGLATSQAKEQS